MIQPTAQDVYEIRRRLVQYSFTTKQREAIANDLAAMRKNLGEKVFLEAMQQVHRAYGLTSDE